MRRPTWAAGVEELAEAVALRHRLGLVGLDVLGEGKRTIIRVSVEDPEDEAGVSVDLCARVADELGRALDLHDPVPHGYTLEVASPGLDRPLRTAADFRRFAGRKAEVVTSEAIEGRRRWKGRLLGLEGDRVLMEVGGRAVHVPLEGVARAHLVVEMEDLREDFARGGRVEP